MRFSLLVLLVLVACGPARAATLAVSGSMLLSQGTVADGTVADGTVADGTVAGDATLESPAAVDAATAVEDANSAPPADALPTTEPAAESSPQPNSPQPNSPQANITRTQSEPGASAPTNSPVDQSPPTQASASRPGANAAKPSKSDAHLRVWLNFQTNMLMGVVLVVLGIASLVGRYLRRQPTEYLNPALVRRFRQRLSSWWLMCAILVFGLVLQPIGTVALFAAVSFWALREFITMTPTRRGDHRALFWALIVITPIQYVLIALEHFVSWGADSNGLYGIYSILIPVYATLLIPARVALSGDPKRFLERSAQITFGLLICVYSLSFAPALINLQLKTSDGLDWGGSPAGLLFYLILVSQLSDILQWTWGHLVGRRVIAPEISSGRTWEGFAGGTFSTGMLGAALYWVTPFQFWEAACISMVIAVMGMFGGMTMSAIKRDRGVNDYGTLVLGHAGVLDRIDSLCFAAPVFYHLTRFFYS